VDNITIGSGAETRDIAILRRAGKAPGLFWLGGFRSEMTGTKANAIDALGAASGLAVTRFDYSGCGASGGQFVDGSMSRWLAEALAVFATTSGPQIVVGSSMGGWLALLLNKTLREQGDDRVGALVLIAPAVDMTEDLMRVTFSPAELHALHNEGRVARSSPYAETPDILTEKLIVDGQRHLLFPHGSIACGCRIAILQGGLDTDVPKEHAFKLLAHLTRDPVTFTLIPDGDHRLSRDADLEKLREVVTRLVSED
jgi:pimeloyl-ACP methyl ester carboxylesterase